MNLIDGKKIAASLRNNLSREIILLKKIHNKVPGLAVVQVGNVAASSVYVKAKTKNAREVGIEVFDHHLDENISENELLNLIDKLIQIDDLPKGTILTPHIAEFSRIFDVNLNDIKKNLIAEIKKIINILNGRILILKGPSNVIVTSKGEILILNHGTSSLATAGTGDVLSGILAALTVRGCLLDDVALLGPYLHGECAHLYNALFSNYGLTASVLLEMLPYAMESVEYVY